MCKREALPSEFEPRFLEHMDGRTVAARTLRQRLAAIYSDLGGEAKLSYAKRSLCRRVVWLESWLETQEAQASEGKPIDIGRQTQALNSLLGIWRTLGIERRASSVPSLQDYISRSGAQV